MRWPNESEEYRRARDELLQAEIELRRREEAVAAKRRALPLGGRLKEDYAFAGPSGSCASPSSSPAAREGERPASAAVAAQCRRAAEIGTHQVVAVL
jgi:hypothetical protein